MNRAKSRPRHFLLIVLISGLVSTTLASCRSDEQRVGMTLLFQSAGRPVGVWRFDPDGVRGPVPGAVDGMFPHGGAEMSFIPGDSARGMPQFVDVAWVAPLLESGQAASGVEKTPGVMSKVRWRNFLAELNVAYRITPTYTRRIDLTSIITPELLGQVRANAQDTQLKLFITFHNEDVDVKAMAYKWR